MIFSASFPTLLEIGIGKTFSDLLVVVTVGLLLYIEPGGTVILTVATLVNVQLVDHL